MIEYARKGDLRAIQKMLKFVHEPEEGDAGFESISPGSNVNLKDSNGVTVCCGKSSRFAAAAHVNTHAHARIHTRTRARAYIRTHIYTVTLAMAGIILGFL